MECEGKAFGYMSFRSRSSVREIGWGLGIWLSVKLDEPVFGTRVE